MCNTIQTLALFSLISDHTLSKAIGASIGVLVLVVMVGVVIWWVLKRGNSRKENTKGDYSIPRIMQQNFSRSEFYKRKRVTFCYRKIR